MAGTVLTYAPAGEHTLSGHPESEERLAGLLSFLDKKGVLPNLSLVESVSAGREQMSLVHTDTHLQRIQAISLRGGGRINADTYVTADSYDLGLIAAGSCCAAVDHILTGRAANGLALIRPPGHHAGENNAEGFCLFNNVAIVARQAQAAHGVGRVMIIDLDVHHGNGTQQIFYEDEGVLFVSLHMYYPFFYPGTGSMSEIGQGSGRGYTLNVPFPTRVGDEGYGRALDEVVLPRARRFAPELLLVSIGYDAHWQDPLAMAGLSLQGYADMARKLIDLATSVCRGRVLFVLEGGYYLKALHYGILNTALALCGQDEVHDPVGPMPGGEQDVTNLLVKLKQLHLLN